VCREDHSQDLVDKRVGGYRAVLRKLKIVELQQLRHQYTLRERLGTSTSTIDGQFWMVESLTLVVREKHGVKYQRRTSYSLLLHVCGFSYQKMEMMFKSRTESKVAAFEEQVENTNRCSPGNARYSLFSRR
jgi:transposase